MGKVVTSEGLSAFIETGTPTETIAAAQRVKPNGAAPALELVTTQPPADAPEQKAAPESKDDPNEGLEADDADLAERAKRRINAKHRAMKQAEAVADKARADVLEAERFAEAQFNERKLLENRLREIESKVAQPTPPVVQVTAEPDPKTYYDDQGQFKAFEYAKDLAKHAAEKAVADDRAKQAELARQAQDEAERAAFTQRMEAVAKEIPDWKAVVSASDVKLQNAVLDYMAHATYGAQLAYFLAKNPEIAEGLNKLSPLLAVAEAGALATQFVKKAESKATPAPTTEAPVRGAPAPIVPIRGEGTQINTDPSKMSYKELRAFERSRERAQATR